MSWFVQRAFGPTVFTDRKFTVRQTASSPDRSIFHALRSSHGRSNTPACAAGPGSLSTHAERQWRSSRIRHGSTSPHARQGSVWPYFPAGSQTPTAISFVCCAQRRFCRSNCWSSCIAIWSARRGCARSWSFWLILRQNDELNHRQVFLVFPVLNFGHFK